MLVTLSGKGGVGKTSLAALLIDEVARRNYTGRILVVDGDPAMTLHLTLGLPEPKATLADVREKTSLNAKTIRSLPPGTTPSAYIHQRLNDANVIVPYRLRNIAVQVMAMGQGEGKGCYCAVNNALSEVLEAILSSYDLVIVDNEAGLEHLNRYRVKRVDLFLVVATPSPASLGVACRVYATARNTGMSIGKAMTVVNGGTNGVRSDSGYYYVPYSETLRRLDMEGKAVVVLADNDPVRVALSPIVEKVVCV